MKKIPVILLIAMLCVALLASCQTVEQGSGETAQTSGEGESETSAPDADEKPNSGNADNGDGDDMDELGNGQTSVETDKETESETETETETETESTHILLPDEEVVDTSETEEVTYEDIDEDWGLGGIPLD